MATVGEGRTARDLWMREHMSILSPDIPRHPYQVATSPFHMHWFSVPCGEEKLSNQRLTLRKGSKSAKSVRYKPIVAFRQNRSLMILAYRTVVEHYGKSISSDDPRHLHYKANLLNNPLLRKKPNLPFVITVKRRFGIPVDSPSGESVPSTNSHIMPDMPDSSSILAQSVIAETQAGSKAHQSLRQNSSKRVGNRSTKQPLLPPLFESVRKSARTRASSALLAASVYQAQHGTPSEPSEGRRDTDGSSAENSTALANVGVGPVLTPATSVTPDSVAFAVPPLPERADSSKSSAYVTEDDTGVPATQRSSLVSTDTETADQPFDTRDVSGPFASAAEAHNAGSSKTFRPLQPHSVDTLIHRPDGDHQVDSHRTDADRERCDPVTYREQTPGPFQRRADDESSSEVSSDEHIRARSPDVGIQVGGPVVDLMGNTEDSEGCEREQAASCTPSTEHAFTTEVDIISKSLAEDPSKQLADAPSSPLLRNTFLAVNSQPSKPLSTTSRLSGDSTSTNVIPDIIHSKLTACTTRTPAKQEHTFLPLTSIADELRPVPNFDAKLSASLGSDGMLASEWVRGLEDTLFTRLKLRFDESFASGQLQVHSGTGTVRKRKSADAPEDGSNQPDKSISEFSQMPEKRIRLVDPAEDDGEHANGREAEARDKLIESLRAENDSYRSQIAELYKMIGNIAGTVSAPIVITESVHSAELAKDPAVR